MHAIKKAIHKLREYLGRDTTGINHLESVAKAANKLRNQVAELSEEAVTSRETISRLRSELSSAQITVDQSASELAHEKARTRQARRDATTAGNRLSELERKIESERLPDIEAPSSSKMERRFVELFSELRRDYGVCPHPSSIGEDETLPVMEYDLWDLTRGLSNSDILKVGRFVVCRALFNFPVTIRSSRKVTELDEGTENNDDKHWIGRVVNWMRSILDTETNYIGGEWQAIKGNGSTIRNKRAIQ